MSTRAPRSRPVLRLAATIFAIATLASAFAVAGGVTRDRHEKRTDRREVADDRHEMADDARDLRQLTSLVDRWHAARASKDAALERSADEGLMVWIRRELRESNREVQEARVETGGSQAEAADSRRERNRDVATGRPIAAADDTGDLRDDRRDVQDDKRDAAAKRAENRSWWNIASDLDELQPSFAKGTATEIQYARKSALLRELQRLAESELARDAGESREDKGELREDRKETREDRRRR